MTDDIVKRLRKGVMCGDDPIVDEAADRIEELEAALRRMLIEFDFLIESGHLPDIRRDIIFDDARVALREKKDGFAAKT